MEVPRSIPLSAKANRLLFEVAPSLAQASNHKVTTFAHVAGAFFEEAHYQQAFINSGIDKSEILSWGSGFKVESPKPQKDQPPIPLTEGSPIIDRNLKSLIRDARVLANQEKAREVNDDHLFRTLMDPSKDGAFHDIYFMKDADSLSKAILEDAAIVRKKCQAA